MIFSTYRTEAEISLSVSGVRHIGLIVVQPTVQV